MSDKKWTAPTIANPGAWSLTGDTLRKGVSGAVAYQWGSQEWNRRSDLYAPLHLWLGAWPDGQWSAVTNAGICHGPKFDTAEEAVLYLKMIQP